MLSKAAVIISFQNGILVRQWTFWILGRLTHAATSMALVIYIALTTYFSSIVPESV